LAANSPKALLAPSERTKLRNALRREERRADGSKGKGSKGKGKGSGYGGSDSYGSNDTPPRHR
jgi:hypothetical protein